MALLTFSLNRGGISSSCNYEDQHRLDL